MLITFHLFNNLTSLMNCAQHLNYGKISEISSGDLLFISPILDCVRCVCKRSQFSLTITIRVEPVKTQLSWKKIKKRREKEGKGVKLNKIDLGYLFIYLNFPLKKYYRRRTTTWTRRMARWRTAGRWRASRAVTATRPSLADSSSPSSTALKRSEGKTLTPSAAGSPQTSGEIAVCGFCLVLIITINHQLWITWIPKYSKSHVKISTCLIEKMEGLKGGQ